MSYGVYTRDRKMVLDPPLEDMERYLTAPIHESLDESWVSLTHESEWCLIAYPDGLLVLQNEETGEGPWHLEHVSVQAVLELWHLLSQGQIGEVRALPWVPG